MAVSDVTDQDFNQVVVESDKLTVVDYWADWCSPCKQLSPIIEELAVSYPDIQFVKLDTNSNTQIPMQQGVMSLPTIQFWRGGQVVKAMQGGQTKMALKKAIEDLK